MILTLIIRKKQMEDNKQTIEAINKLGDKFNADVDAVKNEVVTVKNELTDVKKQLSEINRATVEREPVKTI